MFSNFTAPLDQYSLVIYKEAAGDLNEQFSLGKGSVPIKWKYLYGVPFFSFTWIWISSESSCWFPTSCPALWSVTLSTTLSPVRPLVLAVTLIPKLCSDWSSTLAWGRRGPSKNDKNSSIKSNKKQQREKGQEWGWQKQRLRQHYLLF